MAFIFGGNTGNTYEGLQRQRKIAESLLAQSSGTPRNVGEGLTAIGNALAYRAIEKRAAKTEEKLRGEFDTAFSGVFGGGGPAMGAGGDYTPSGTWTPGAPPPKATNSYMGMPDVTTGGLSFDLQSADTGVSQGGNSFGSAVMTPQEMLIAGAKARGLDPIDVATAISYETGGKFDPLVKGPTTQWGQHEGLIQFGDPQGVEHGAVFDQGADAAWRSQLDPTNGAVWSYLESTGVKPGMGLDNIYSAINAGGVNRFTASDANNGGVPGTVADKVAGMGDHRANAARFLGGTWTPTPGGQPQPAQAPQMDLGTLSELAGNPYATPGQRAVLEALIGQQMQAADPLRQIELQRAQLELAQMQNPKVDPMAAVELQQAQLELAQMQEPQTVKPLEERKALAAEAGLQPGTPEYQAYIATGNLPTPNGGSEFGLNPIMGRDAEGNAIVMQLGKDGTAVVTRLPEGVTPDMGLKAYETAQGTALGKGAGEAQIEAQVALPGAAGLAEQVSGQVETLKNDPYLENMLGPIDRWKPNVSEDAARVQGMMDQLKGGAFLQARQLLKGGGAITDFEGQKAEAAFIRMNDAQKPEDYKAALDEFNFYVQQGLAKLEAQARGQAPTGGGLGEWQTIDGVKIRVKQ